MERLTKADPDNAHWQRDLSLAHERVGMVQAMLGQFAEAFASFKHALALRQRLADAAPAEPPTPARPVRRL